MTEFFCAKTQSEKYEELGGVLNVIIFYLNIRK